MDIAPQMEAACATTPTPLILTAIALWMLAVCATVTTRALDAMASPMPSWTSAACARVTELPAKHPREVCPPPQLREPLEEEQHALPPLVHTRWLNEGLLLPTFWTGTLT
jgi:hypothetical protein